MKLVVFGLSLSSSWGNGHATTYRALLRAFAARGHEITFYEWDAPWYGGVHRDHPDPDYARLVLYSSWAGIRKRAIAEARAADATVVGSYVRGGPEIIDELAAAAVDPLIFYDIDTPVTVAALRAGGAEYLRPDQVPLFSRYLSFTGGPFLQEVLEDELGARAASALYCSVDPASHRPTAPDPEFAVDLGYMGTYAESRQAVIDRLLVEVAQRLPGRSFLVAGPQYPPEIEWPSNVRLIPHLPPAKHAAFYSSVRWQLNATRAEMAAAGWSPSVRLFEAGAVGAAVISDRWEGIDTLFTPEREIALPECAEQVMALIEQTDEQERIEMGRAMRRRILNEHTAEIRAAQFEEFLRKSSVPAAVEAEGWGAELGASRRAGSSAR